MKLWRLMLWDVPEGLTGLTTRLGFKPTKKNPRHWWRTFDPSQPGERDKADAARALLLDAGIKGSWQQVEEAAKPPARAYKHRHFVPSHPDRGGFGHGLNARPIAGSWRMRSRHK